MSAERVIEFPHRSRRLSGFQDWRAKLDRENVAPIVAITGSRGKTSILRALESIFRSSGLRSATWSGRGVEIDGERQRGELGPWVRAQLSLSAGGLDIAIRELDWATILALGRNPPVFPVVAVANLCGNNHACLVTPDFFGARRALADLSASVTRSGQLVINANDKFVVEQAPNQSANCYHVGLSRDAPMLRRHIEQGGNAAWVEDSWITIQDERRNYSVVDVTNLTWTRHGTIPFAVQNALFAAAVARACGLSTNEIAAGLKMHEARPDLAPGSFNLFETGDATIVIDRPAPSWFLRTSLRAAATLGSGRHIRVAGCMSQVDSSDLFETGRLLGRPGGVLIAHGDWNVDRLHQLRSGAAANVVPPVYLQSVDERSAINQAVGMLRADDVLLILAENPTSAIRQVSQRLKQPVAGQSRGAEPA